MRIKQLFRGTLFALVAVAAYAGPVDINTADAETISAELQGVGITKAIAIVEYRKANGPFKSVDDLVKVKGIGERTVEINRPNILLEPATASSK
ncbi:MAG: helix-hairpin-helix domain-containing protein [Gammaproteobacteria bacterium]|nr:helix-hairpin-helix domain-containing protein [Gammaproteobacteria bacterium]